MFNTVTTQSGGSGTDAEGAADRRAEESWSELRNALAQHRFRIDAPKADCHRVEAAVNRVVRNERARGRYVETVIVRLKCLCADPQLPAPHRFNRMCLASELVQQCIECFYEQHH